MYMEVFIVAILPIIKLFEPNLKLPGTCLRMACEDVLAEDFTASWFHQLVKDMLETLYNEASGVGLSANQVGVLRKISVIDLKRDGKNPLVLINPVIIPASNERVMSDEVCLSFPNISAKVPRYKKIVVAYQDIEGQKRELAAEGYKANVYQHEVSHLYGSTIIDLVSTPDDLKYYPGTASRKAQIAYQKCASKDGMHVQ